jgi:acetyltransferase
MSFQRIHTRRKLLVTAGGQRLQMRDIHPRDAAALIRGFARLSPEEVRMRFLYPMKMLTDELANKLSKLHRHREVAIVLSDFAPPGEAQIFAVVRASRQPYSKAADFAIVVPRALSHQGIGRLLMLELINRCKAAGVTQLLGDVLADNSAMMALARSLGFQFSHHADGAGQLVMSLTLS